MSCRFCGLDLGTHRSSECIGCGAVTCLRQEFTSEWRSGVIRAIAADLALGTARQVRALRLATNRLWEDQATGGPEEEPREDRPTERRQVEEPRPDRRAPQREQAKNKEDSEKKRERSPRRETKSTASSAKPVEARNKGGHEAKTKRKQERHDSLSESYTEYTEDDDKGEKEGVATHDTGGRVIRIEGSKNPPGVTPKSGGVTLSQAPAAVRGRGDQEKEDFEEAELREREHRADEGKGQRRKPRRAASGGKTGQHSTRPSYEEVRSIPEQYLRIRDEQEPKPPSKKKEAQWQPRRR